MYVAMYVYTKIQDNSKKICICINYNTGKSA